jgi:hypothetical protein
MIGITDGRCFLPFQRHDLFQPGPEQSEITRLPGFRPNTLGLRGDASQLLNQFLGEFGRAVVVAANLADIGGRIRFGNGNQFATFDRREQLANSRISQHLMAQPGQECHLFAAMSCAGARHVSPLIPAEQPGAGSKYAGIANAANQFGVGSFGSHPEMI